MLARIWLVREGCRITTHLQLMLRQNLRQKFFNKRVYKYFIVLGLKWYFGPDQNTRLNTCSSNPFSLFKLFKGPCFDALNS